MKLKSHLHVSALVAAAICWAVPNAALATFPEDRYVEYSFREDPSDENSDVVLIARLNLHAVDVIFSNVIWEVESAEFEELDANGATVASWSIDSPTVHTTSGYWNVMHLDTENPANHEFDTPPSIDGTADYVSGTTDDLDFELGSGSLTETEQQMFSGNVAGISHWFQEVSAAEPVDEGDDEPVEVVGGASGAN